MCVFTYVCVIIKRHNVLQHQTCRGLKFSKSVLGSHQHTIVYKNRHFKGPVYILSIAVNHKHMEPFMHGCMDLLYRQEACYWASLSM